VIIVPLMVVLNAGVVVDAHALHGVAQQISRAKQADPEAFHALARLRERLADLDDVEAELEHLGARGLWPMVEMIGFDPAPRGQFADGVWLSWQTSLLEAAGAVRDRRAAPVFEAVLRSDNQPFAVYRAAAQALARVSDEAGASALINLSHGDGLKQDAILAGMGACTRPAVAHALVAELNAHPNPTRAAHVIEGLSELGNVGGDKDDDVQVRDEAAQALVTAYVRYDGEVRRAASNALVSVGAPHTELLIENEKMRGVAVPELKQLEQRIQKPAH
jgi:hypothetical protein